MMQTLKVICAALLWVAVTAYPANETNDIDGPKLEWWENAVFYQIYPRSFKDSNGDGIGDIKGIIQNFDYLVELGIDGAWLSPIFKSPMKDFGYDISDYYNVDPIFGTLADLEELFRVAKEKGIKIILDFVPNHTSDQHEWFKKSIKREGKYTDFYVWADGKNNNTEPPNNWVSNFYGPAWTFVKERNQWYYHEFAKEQPDLNYRSKLVVEEMTNFFNFWLKKGASGFRIDAVNFLFEYEDLRDEPLSGKTNDSNSYHYTLHDYTMDLPEMYDMVYKFREIVDEYHKQNGGPRPILMTEAYTNATEYPKYFKSKDGKKLGSEMPFNFELIKLTKDSKAIDFKNTIDQTIASVPAGTRLNWVMGNHDRPRVGSRLGERKIDGALTLVMTLPGIAVTYMGEEIGMLDNRDGISYADTVDPKACNVNETGDWKELSRDPQRTPFQWDSSKYAGFMPANVTKVDKPWLPVHPNYLDINVALQKDFERSTLKFYKELLELRKEDTFAYGSFNSSVVNDNVFAYVRALNGSATYVVLINFGAREELIDITTVTEGIDDNLGCNMKIVAAGADSCYSQNATVRTTDVLLRKYDAIVLKGHKCECHHGDGGSGASPSNNVVAVGLLLMSMIAVFIF